MIRDKIKQELSKRGMTQLQLAEKMGVSPESLSRTINGNPTVKSLKEIADAIEIEVAQLFSKININGFIEINGVTKKIDSVQDLFDALDKVMSIDEVMQRLPEKQIAEFKSRLEHRLEHLETVDYLRKKGKLIE